MIFSETDDGLGYAVLREGKRVACCSLTVRCGTREENVRGSEKSMGDFHSGTAHFVEHTLFKGTREKSSSVINSYLERLGGELNAYTTKEEIVLHATVLKEDIEKAVALLLEMATQATFPEDEIEVEKTVVIDEIASYKDSPADDIYDRFESLVFEGHPLSGRVLGTPSSVKKISADELRRFVGEFFVPERMALSVVAPLPENELEDMVRRLSAGYFGAWRGENGHTVQPKDDRCGREVSEPVEFQGNVFSKTVNRHSHQANCIIGATAPSLYRERERIAAALMANILGGPATNSILNSVLREKNGWVYNIECNYSQYADSGLMAVCFGCDREHLDDCIRVVEEEIGKLQDRPLGEEGLRAAKKQFVGQLTISSESSESQSLSMGKSLVAFGTIQDDDAVRAKIEAVTAEEIQSAARSIFNPARLSKLIYS